MFDPALANSIGSDIVVVGKKLNRCSDRQLVFGILPGNEECISPFGSELLRFLNLGYFALAMTLQLERLAECC